MAVISISSCDARRRMFWCFEVGREEGRREGVWENGGKVRRWVGLGRKETRREQLARRGIRVLRLSKTPMQVSHLHCKFISDHSGEYK